MSELSPADRIVTGPAPGLSSSLRRVLILLWLVSAPVLGLLAVGLWEESVRVVRAWVGWFGIRARSGSVDEVLARRARLVAATEIGETGAHGQGGPPQQRKA